MSSRLSAKIAWHVAECLQFAFLLEISAYPKPGNFLLKEKEDDKRLKSQDGVD